MAAPSTSAEFLEIVRKSGLVEQNRLDAWLHQQGAASSLPSAPKQLAVLFVQEGLLTNFQGRQLLLGKSRGFTIGKYKILERLGAGGSGTVYLCEHLAMRRHVAVKVLPLAKAANPSLLARFQREARAAAALDHPNIVHTYDSDREGDFHYLVMEYVDGLSLNEIVARRGPLVPLRAAHYIRQAALGLQHIYEMGLIHRDIKPSNLLLDRAGTVKILDLGLARFFRDHDDLLTQQQSSSCILGTADYLSPEQSLDSHEVDIRTDIYSLGATLYFLLTGRPPFEEKVLAQKLLSQLVKEPPPLRTRRPEVPETLAAVVAKMMAKDRDERYQIPRDVVEALAPWTGTPIAPPAEEEMPQLCPAVLRVGLPRTASVAPAKSVARARATKQWQLTAPRPAADARRSSVESPIASGTRSRPSDTPDSKIAGPGQARLVADDDALCAPKAMPPIMPPKGKDHLSQKRLSTGTKKQISGNVTIPDLSNKSSSDRRSTSARSPSTSPPRPRFKMMFIALVILCAIGGGIVFGWMYTRNSHVSVAAPATTSNPSRP
jgi:serine/threonine protein kinase